MLEKCKEEIHFMKEMQSKVSKIGQPKLVDSYHFQ